MPSLPMSWSQWQQTDATALAQLVRDRQVTAEEVTAQAATAVEILNPQLQASLEVFPDAVEDPTAAGANSDSPMFGVPMFMKDSGSGMAGRLREWGSLLTTGQRAAQDCPLTTNLRRAGFNLLGRSTLPEWGKTFDTTTSYLGHVMTARNPWNLQLTQEDPPAAARPWSQLAPYRSPRPATRPGSTRVPAAFTGLIGLKPSRGLLPPPPPVTHRNK